MASVQDGEVEQLQMKLKVRSIIPHCTQIPWILLLGLATHLSKSVQEGSCSASDAEELEGGLGERRVDEDERGVREKADMARKVARLLDAEREGGMSVANAFLPRFYPAGSHSR